MRVLHVVPSFWPAVRYGGPIYSVLRLCTELRRQGVDVRVATTDADGPSDLGVATERWTEVEGVPVRYFQRRPRTDFTFSAELARFLVSECNKFELIHVTSLFSFPSLVADRVAAWRRVPFVVSPRGSFLPAARRLKAWKKLPYWWVVERPNLRGAAGIHATSDAECDAIQQALPGSTVFVVPNGVDLPKGPPAVQRHSRRIAFLGRIHPIKGFDLLVPALSALARRIPDVETVVAGPDDVGYREQVERMLAQCTPRPRVTWLGPVSGSDKERFLAEASVVVVPSHSENFGQVVVEALAAGTPVVASHGTPWSALEEVGAGRWLDREPEVWATELERILCDAELHRRMSSAARELAGRYGWDSVARRMFEWYQRILVAHRRTKD